MLTIKERSELPDGNIVNAPEQTITITINLEGVAGAGVAKSMRDDLPEVYVKYRKACNLGLLSPNSLTTVKFGEGKQALLFPTKILWRNPSPKEMVMDNLKRLGEIYERLGITSLAFVPPGMSNGWLRGNDKKEVWDFLVKTLESMDIPVVLYK